MINRKNLHSRYILYINIFFLIYINCGTNLSDKFFRNCDGMNNKKKDSRRNDEVTNTFVPAVFLQTSLRFPQTIVPINTRRANCSSLTGARCSQPTNYTEETIWWARGKQERDKFVNFKYDCGNMSLETLIVTSLHISRVSVKSDRNWKNCSHSSKYWHRLKNKNRLLQILCKIYL